MQEQTQNDKMVPIDTSGEGVEVQLETKEDQVSQPDVQVEETQTAPVQEGKEEELEEYSQSVKRRIDKLTKKMREAERRESAAIEYAKNVNEKLKRSETLGLQKDERSIKEGDARIKTQEEFTKRAMEAVLGVVDIIFISSVNNVFVQPVLLYLDTSSTISVLKCHTECKFFIS